VEVATWKVRAEFRGHRDRVTAWRLARTDGCSPADLTRYILGWERAAATGTSRGSIANAWDALASADAGMAFQHSVSSRARQSGRMVRGRVTPAVRPDPAA